MTSTPGPWHPKRSITSTDGEYDWGVGADIDGRRHCIAEAFGRVAHDVRPDAEANARLIAAAPDLVDATQALRAALMVVFNHAAGYNWNADPLYLTLITGAALTKAHATLSAAGADIETPVKVHADATKDMARALGASIP